MNNYFSISIYINLNNIYDFSKLSVSYVVIVDVTLAVTLEYVFFNKNHITYSVIFDNNIFNFVSVLVIILLILLLSIIVDDCNELFKLCRFIGVLSLLLFIHVLHLNITFCYLNI